MISEGEGAKTYRERQVLLLPNHVDIFDAMRQIGVAVLKHGENFDLCGGRLKAPP